MIMFSCENMLEPEDSEPGIQAYTITFNGNGADVEASFNSATVTSDSPRLKELPLPPEKDGYFFRGWYYRDYSISSSDNPTYPNVFISLDTEFSHSMTVTAMWSTRGFESGLYIARYSNHIEICGVEDPDTEILEIPDELLGLPVTKFYYKAFMGNDALRKITIPNSITRIDSSVFSGCTAMEEVVLPSTLESISGEAFKDCTSLADITIPETVTEIGDNAFDGCTSLATLHFNAELVSDYHCGDDVFANCSSLTRLEIGDNCTYVPDDLKGIVSLEAFNAPSDHSVYSTFNGVLYRADYTYLIRYPAAKTGLTYYIPSSVIKTSNIAPFDNCLYLEKVFLESDIESNVYLESLLRETSVQELVIGSNVHSIGYYFYSMPSLMRYTVDAGNTEFASVDGVLFSKDLTELFYYPGSRPGDYTIPEEVNDYYGYVLNPFRSAGRLMNIFVEPGNTKFTSENGILYNSGGTELLCYPQGKTETLFTVPDRVSVIGDDAFIYNRYLKDVIIPGSVKVLEYHIFSYAYSFDTVFIPSTVETLHGNTFVGWTSDQTINFGHATPIEPYNMNPWNWDCDAVINWGQPSPY